MPRWNFVCEYEVGGLKKDSFIWGVVKGLRPCIAREKKHLTHHTEYGTHNKVQTSNDKNMQFWWEEFSKFRFSV